MTTMKPAAPAPPTANAAAAINAKQTFASEPEGDALTAPATKFATTISAAHLRAAHCHVARTVAVGRVSVPVGISVMVMGGAQQAAAVGVRFVELINAETPAAHAPLTKPATLPANVSLPVTALPSNTATTEAVKTSSH